MKQDWIEIGGIILCAAMFLVATAADDSRLSNGDWEMNSWPRGDTVHLELKRATPVSRWNWSFNQPIAELHGLTREQIRSAHAPVKFTIERDAGTFAFEGTLLLGLGGGRYQFIPNSAFARQLSELGYSSPSDADLVRFAMSDISLTFAREVKKAGLQTSDANDLLRLHDHGVGLDFIREVSFLGYKDFTAEDLTRLKDHGVNINFLRAIRDSGYSSFNAEEITRLCDHGVDSAFLHGIRNSGWKGSPDDLVNLHDHGVQPELVKALTAAGYTNLSADEITRLRDNGVDAKYISQLAASGFGNVSVEDIVKLRNHGVD